MTTPEIRAEAERCFAVGAQSWQAGRLELAEQAFARAVNLMPGWASAHANLGAILRRRGKSPAALACYRRALWLDPDHAATLSNMGNALRDLGLLDEAEMVLRRAVALAPDIIGYVYNLALVLRDLRRHQEAEALLESVVKSDPGNAEYEWDLALSRLYGGDYRAGFAGYEARLRLSRNPARDISGPRWDGGDVAGKTILLSSEQGFGDALQFARYVPLLAERGAAIILECLPDLAELFAGLAGVKALIAKGAPLPPYDLWAPMTSLPHLMGTTFETIPARMPYLTAPPRPNLVFPRPEGARMAIGLVWAGKTTPRDRSWPLEELLPLMRHPMATFYSLQLGPRREDLVTQGVERLLIDGAPALTSFAETAAVMERLDLVITIDTSTCHLAGALGKPVWVLLRHVSDWRWQDEPLTSPWYPTMRLFRQPSPDDFKTPVAEMVKALDVEISSRAIG